MVAQQLVAGEDATASDHPSDACRAVFGIPELLDAILTFLPSRDILIHGQRVCKQWNSAIASSPTIQTKLWRRSQANDPILPAGTIADHPLATSMLSGILLYRHALHDDLPLYSVAVAHNDFCLSPQDRKSSLVPTHFEHNCSGDNAPTRHQFSIGNVKRTLGALQSTLLDMYLTEPPITIARLAILMPFDDDELLFYKFSSVSVREPSGLTPRVVLDVLDKVCQSGVCGLPSYSLQIVSRARVLVEFFSG